MQRSIVAEQFGIDEDKVKCRNCTSFKFDSCKFWDSFVGEEMFCLMFKPKED